MTKETRNSAH